MSFQLRVTKWFGRESTAPIVHHLESLDGVSWFRFGKPDKTVRLKSILRTLPEGALNIEILGERCDPGSIAAHLPTGSDYEGSISRGVETGDEFDEVVDDAGLRVLIDGYRWGLFSGRWIECDDWVLGDENPRPRLGRLIASGGCEENDSATGGAYTWALYEIDAKVVCEEECPGYRPDTTYDFLDRRGRSDEELVRAFAPHVFEPVMAGLLKSLETGEDFVGRARDLDPDMSGTMDVWVELSLRR